MSQRWQLGLTHFSTGSVIAVKSTMIMASAALCLWPPDARCWEVEATAQSGESRNHALLIGVTKYPGLGTAYQLRGPSNDVVLLERLFKTHFGFSSQNIVALSEPHGAVDSRRLPTRTNIEREMTQLAKAAQPGAWVVILFAGHGSQTPQADDAHFLEPDGLDEILLPRDVTSWDEGLQGVPQAIRDDELGAWIAAIRARGALVWLIVDACHSGTMLRGPGEMVRQVPPEASTGLAIPPAILQKARAALSVQPSQATRGERAPPTSLELNDFSGVVALYACQPWELAVEKELPVESEAKEPHGLLTFTLCQVLSRSKNPLTFRQLARLLFDAYIDMGRTSPTPFIEGGERDRPVLGGISSQGGYAPMSIHARDGKLYVNAGSLIGLTQGTVLAVRAPPPADPAAVPLGHVEVRRLALAEAEVAPIEFTNVPLPEANALTGGHCQIAAFSYNEHVLDVMVDRYNDLQQSTDPASRQQVIAALEEACAPTSPIRVTDASSQADWIVRIADRQVYLIPASGSLLQSSRPIELTDAAPRLGPAPLNDQLAMWLRDHLERIARAERLRILATTTVPQASVALAGTLGLTVRLSDASGKPVEWPTDGWLEFRDGDRLNIVLHNQGRTPLDVTLLYIDSGFGIEALFPTRTSGESNRLPPGAEFSVSVSASARTSGLEHLIVIALPGKGPLVDFTCLEQSTLADALQVQQRRGVRRERGLESPLGRLLTETVYPTRLRAVRQTEWNDYQLSRLSWFVVPKANPALSTHFNQR